MPTDVVEMATAHFSHGCKALYALDMINTYFSELFSSWSECEAALRNSTQNLLGIVDVQWLVVEGAPVAGDSAHQQLNPLNEVFHPSTHARTHTQRTHTHAACPPLHTHSLHLGRQNVFKFMQNHRVLGETNSRMATLYLWQHQLRTTTSSGLSGSPAHPPAART